MLCQLNSIQLDWPGVDQWLLSTDLHGQRSVSGLCVEQSALYWLRGINGVGKSTWLKAVQGLLPCQGGVDWSMCVYSGDLDKSIYGVFTVDYFANSWVVDVLRQEYLIRMGTEMPAALLTEGMGRFLLSSVKSSRWGQLSSGQKRACGLFSLQYTRCLLWVLDEPFVHLDDSLSSVLQSMMAGHIQAGGAVLLVSHERPFHVDYSMFLHRVF